MKKAVLALAAIATVATGYATASYAADDGLRVQVQYYDDDNGYRPRPDDRGWGGPDRRPNWGDDGYRREIIGPRGVTRILERRGYNVGDIRLRRDVYVVRASRPSGRRVIVMVDAYSGRIVGERNVGY